jgi:hypothetical protein
LRLPPDAGGIMQYFAGNPLFLLSIGKLFNPISHFMFLPVDFSSWFSPAVSCGFRRCRVIPFKELTWFASFIAHLVRSKVMAKNDLSIVFGWFVCTLF